MHRYFVSNLENDNFLIENDNFHHLKNVVKLKKDTNIVCIFNNESYSCILVEIMDDYAVAKKVSKIKDLDQTYNVTLIVGIIREQKWDFILQKATELGVNTIVPVEFKRNVVKISKDKEETKILRWTKICEDASEQSYKSFVPLITNVVRNLNELKKYKSDLNLCCYENGELKNLRDLYQNKKNFTFIIGPEGGIEEKEILLLSEMGYEAIKFSNNILRAETVPIYLLSTLMFNFG